MCNGKGFSRSVDMVHFLRLNEAKGERSMKSIFFASLVILLSFKSTGLLIGTDSYIYSSLDSNDIIVNTYSGKLVAKIDIFSKPNDAALWGKWLIVATMNHPQGTPVIDTETNTLAFYLPKVYACAVTVIEDHAFLAEPQGNIVCIDLHSKKVLSEKNILASGIIKFLLAKDRFLYVGKNKQVVVYELGDQIQIKEILDEEEPISLPLLTGPSLRYLTRRKSDLYLVIYNVEEGQKSTSLLMGTYVGVDQDNYALLGLDYSLVACTLQPNCPAEVFLKYLGYFDWLLREITPDSIVPKADDTRFPPQGEGNGSQIFLNGIECCTLINRLSDEQKAKMLDSAIWKDHRNKLIRKLMPGIFISQKYCRDVLRGLLRLKDPVVTEAWKIAVGMNPVFKAYPKGSAQFATVSSAPGAKLHTE